MPTNEFQNLGGFDRMACVTYSAWNCLEILFKRKFGLSMNFSDRFTAKLSGTTKDGNSFYNVAESIRTLHGGVPETAWPDVTTNFEDYYKEVANEVVALGKELFPSWVISYEFVWDTTDSLWESLQYGPIQVGVFAYVPEVNGIVPRTENRGNHAVSLVNASLGNWWEVFDHYQWITKKLAWDTRFWGALRFDIKAKESAPIPMYAFKEDTMYFVAEGKGMEFAQLAGKLRFDDPNKMSRQIFYRTKGQVAGRYETISLKELEGVTAYDLKGNNLGPAKNLAI